MKSEHVLNSDTGLLRHKRGDLDLCMSELKLTLTAKPFVVLTRVKWAQNATILHYGRSAKCTAAVFVVSKLYRRWRFRGTWRPYQKGKSLNPLTVYHRLHREVAFYLSFIVRYRVRLSNLPRDCYFQPDVDGWWDYSIFLKLYEYSLN